MLSVMRALIVPLCVVLAGCADSTRDPTVDAPVGGRIAFLHAAGLEGPIHVMPADGRRAASRVGPRGRIVWAASWAPDGKRIALITSGTLTAGTMARRAEILTLGSGRSRTIPGSVDSAPPTGSTLYKVAWAAEGGGIALLRANPGGPARGRLVVVDVRGRVLARRRAAGVARDSGLSWSPDGRRIAYGTRTRASLAVLELPTGRLRRLRLPMPGGDPAWSPGGSWIAVATQLGIALVRPSGRGFHIITRGGLKDRTPTWSPDGRWVAYARQSGVCDEPEGKCRQDLYRVPAGGGSSQLVRRTRVLFETGPIWGP
jgi:Tol biopolymer transport system component